jgi:protein tyrosine/serine phosphatase
MVHLFSDHAKVGPMKNFAISLLLVLISNIPLSSFAAEVRDEQDAVESKLSSLITNFHSSSHGIYRGARPQSEEAIRELAQSGIQTVIDLQGGDLENPVLRDLVASQEPGELPDNISREERLVRANHMNFYSFPLNSVAAVSEQEGLKIKRVLELMEQAVREQRPLYIHCEHGKDRTGLLIALFTVFHYRIPASIAHNEMLQYGHGDWLNVIVTSAMDDYFWDSVSHNRFSQLTNSR